MLRLDGTPVSVLRPTQKAPGKQNSCSPLLHIPLLGSREGWAFIDGSTSAADREQIVEKFQNGKLRGIALSIRAAGVGLTLTRAWKAAFVDLDWTPAGNAQAEDRLCRIGQTHEHVEIVHMVSDHPLDQRVMELLVDKSRMIDGAIEQPEQGLAPLDQDCPLVS